MSPTRPPSRSFPLPFRLFSASTRLISILEGKTWRLLDRLQGRKRVHFLHIGKTGGTALKHALAAHRRTRNHILEFHGHAVTLRDIPVGEAVVFFLRDPISRFVSGFYSRMRQGQPRYFYPWSDAEARAFVVFATPNQLAGALSADDEQLRAKAVAAMQGIQHVADSYWEWFEDRAYFLSRQEDILFVGFQESLEQDFEALKAKLDILKEVALPGHDVETHKTPDNLDRHLDETAIKNLKQWYQQDYEFFELCKRLRAAAS